MAAGSNSLTRVFGGSPIGVLLRLVLLCVIVGLVMDQLNLNAFEVLRHAARAIEELIANSADLLRHIGRYFLIGAMVVIPIWILLRIFRMGSGRG
ncbi:DUF6460 domain-containing protein [Hansschlegelia plantiphila]|uniref:DUF6460 domain-containing protein n=1 Tax=Hansschlegelia plantiphila TaxID=374655 RepID=A0A9W6MUN0_9HYPH|nr:DUF6460 domain-containing protein [Hansschlegelia plantiphila]GLK67063.1 hypothetical protein GCM10008179_07010 [Hansschlegelia plantiphila]